MQRAFYNRFLKLGEDREVKKKDKEFTISSENVCSVSQLGWEEQNARRRHKREISARERLRGVGREQQQQQSATDQHKTLKKPHAALSTQGTGNVIVTGVW